MKYLFSVLNEFITSLKIPCQAITVKLLVQSPGKFLRLTYNLIIKTC